MKDLKREYREQMEQNARKKVEQRVQVLCEQKEEAQNIREQITEIKEIEKERKMMMQQEMRDSVKQISDERKVMRDMQTAHDNNRGVETFPFTHGEAVEQF